jgi:hypothetical protein
MMWRCSARNMPLSVVKKTTSCGKDVSQQMAKVDALLASAWKWPKLKSEG